jgi:hypothetical protein
MSPASTRLGFLLSYLCREGSLPRGKHGGDYHDEEEEKDENYIELID